MAKTAKKRKFSAAHRKAISEAAKKRWVGKGKKRGYKKSVAIVEATGSVISPTVAAILSSDIEDAAKVKILKSLANL